MTEPDGMYGEEIRRALSAVADLVVPDGDGLDKIRQRTRHRSPAFAWFTAYATYLPRALINAIRVPGSELILIARGESTVFKRLWAAPRKLTIKASSPQAWLRPAIAAAGALVMVVAIVLAVPRLHQTIAPTAAHNANPGAASVAGQNGGPGGMGQTVGASRPNPGSGSHTSGNPVSPGTTPSNCPSAGSANTGANGSTAPPVNSASARASTASAANQAKNARTQTTHCPSSGPSSHSSAPSSPGSSSPPPSTTPPVSPGGGTPTPTPPVSPGGGNPTPTTSAVSNSTPSPGTSGS